MVDGAGNPLEVLREERLLSAPEEASAPTGTPAAESSLPGLGWAAKERREKRRARSAAAARRKLKDILGPDWPVDVDPIGFRFSLAEGVDPKVGPRHLLRRCVVVRPFVREVFVLAMTACGGSQRSERSFQIPGSKQESVDRALELIPSQVIYASDAWKAQNKRPQVREEKLKKELGKLSCPFDPTLRVSHHPDKGPTACTAVVVTASETQGMFCKVVTRPCSWLEEESPVNAWHGAAVRPPEAIAADEAVRLAHAMGKAKIEIEDPGGILAPLEDLVRSHLVVRAVSGLPGLAEMVDGKPEGWPPAADREVSAEQARREVAKAMGSRRQVLLDPEVADVLRMAAARPALDGDIKPPQRIAVARQRVTEKGLLNASQVGTGKTPMTLIACRGKAAELESYRAIVTLPRALRSQWVEEEIPKFWSEVDVLSFDGGRIANELIRFDRELGTRPGIVVATFEQVRSFVDALRVITYDDLIVEEGDGVANPTTQLSRALWRLRERAKVANVLTATPLGKSLEELDAIEAFARNDREALRRKPISRRYGSLDDMTLRQLRRALGPGLVRVTREEMKDYMPSVGEAEHMLIDPSPAELALLDALEGRIAKLYGDLREQVEREAGLDPDDAELTELRRRMASTRGLLLSATEVALMAAVDAESLRASSSIAAALLESEGLIDAVVKSKPTKRTWIAPTLAAAEADGEQTLVFAQSVELLRLLSRELEDVHGVDAPLYSGQLTEREASQLRRSFRRREFRTLLISPVGRRGLNLPASLVGHYDLPWEARTFEQRPGRATRTGSSYDAVAILLPLMRGTIEEHVAELLVPRAALADGVLNRGEDGTARHGEGGSRELALQLGGLASDLAAREGSSTKMRIAAQIFNSRLTTPVAA